MLYCTPIACLHFLRQRPRNRPNVCRKRTSRVYTGIFCYLKSLLLLVKLETVENLLYCQNWMFTRFDYGTFVDYHRNPCK